MARSTPRHESPQPLAEMNDHAVHPRVASSASLNTTSATNSDNEGGEKPVREKLKATTIAGQPQDVPSPEIDMGDAEDAVQPTGEETTRREDDAYSGSDSDRGRLRRKRSFDDIDGDRRADKTPEKPERHTRKKSRDIKTGEMEQYRKSSGESSVSRIDEHDGDEPMKSTESRPTTPSDSASKIEGMVSPKNKRSREEYLEAEKDVPETAKLPSSIVQPGESKNDATEERQPKRHRDSNSPKSSTEEDKPKQVKIPPGSGFANVSTTSPFASIGNKTQPGFGSFGAKKNDENTKAADTKAQTSTSAFQKSGLGSFASTSSPFASLSNIGSASPFGAAATAGKPSTGFGAPSKSPTSSESSFGALASSGKSTFGGASAGFGGGFGAGFGGGFGSLSKPAGSSFAAPGTSGITGLSDKPAKPFGAQEDSDSDSDSGDDADQEDADSKPYHMEEGGRDKRFYVQEVSTGEEDEDTIFVSRAKVYSFSRAGEGGERGWKERGVGDLKLNVPKGKPASGDDDDDDDDDNDGRPKVARLIMRAEGSKRLILNWPLKKDLKFGTPEGDKPTGMQVLFPGQLAGSEVMETISLKMKSERAQEIWQHVNDLQKDM